MSGLEKLKLWAAATLLLVAVYVLGYAELRPAARFGTAVLSAAIALALVVFSQSGATFFRFVRDSAIELRKVVWPNKQEVMQMTGVVFAFLTVVTLFLWVVDWVINFLLAQLVR